MRGIRGATTVDNNDAETIVEATGELLRALIAANDIEPADIAGAWFTTTRDLTAEFPAIAARKLGWTRVPLLCGHEMDVDEANPRSIPRCVRVLILLNTNLDASEMKFVYLRGAAAIRADLDQLAAEVHHQAAPGADA